MTTQAIQDEDLIILDSGDSIIDFDFDSKDTKTEITGQSSTETSNDIDFSFDIGETQVVDTKIVESKLEETNEVSDIFSFDMGETTQTQEIQNISETQTKENDFSFDIPEVNSEEKTIQSQENSDFSFDLGEPQTVSTQIVEKKDDFGFDIGETAQSQETKNEIITGEAEILDRNDILSETISKLEKRKEKIVGEKSSKQSKIQDLKAQIKELENQVKELEKDSKELEAEEKGILADIETIEMMKNTQQERSRKHNLDTIKKTK